jgi:hypothetical protein
MSSRKGSYSRSRDVKLAEKMPVCTFITLHDALEKDYMIIIYISVKVGRKKHRQALPSTPFVECCADLAMVSISGCRH